MKKTIYILILAALGLQAQAQFKRVVGIGNFKTVSGEQITNCKIGYEVFGHLDKAGSSVVLFPTWFSGNTDQIVQYIKPWQFIDTTKYCLILVDALGNGVSSSPSNSTTQKGNAFPHIVIRDMVNSEYELLTIQMGIKHLYAIFGISMGAIQAYQWAVSYPGFADRIIPISGTPKLSSYDLLDMTALKRIIEENADYNHGNYKTNPAIPIASMLFDVNLTSPLHVAKSLPADKVQAQIQNYEKPPAFDWNNFHTQLVAILDQDISRDYGGSMPETAKHIQAKMLIVNNKQDHTVNPLPAMDFAKLLPAKVLFVDNELGHQGVDYIDAQFKAKVKEMLEAQ